MKEFNGSRWYKCDLHLHTTASRCFRNQEVTAEQWVERAIAQGLDCVAVTDHNSSKGIAAIQEVAKDTTLTVFPGVEITCDTSKIHFLILFDPVRTATDVRNFLIRCGLDEVDFGNQDAKTTKSINDIADMASEYGALVIPAHIDEFNGLESVGQQVLKEFFNRPDINAVQVVHKSFFENSYTTNTIGQVLPSLNDYYNHPAPAIDESTAKKWYTAVKLAKEAEIAILTFSDNPHEPKDSKHGLDGVGRRFSYIKMDEKPTLEGLRQAFLLSKQRIANDFSDNTSIQLTPDYWIKSITIDDTTLTGEDSFKVGFNPQLNTIIGGRGSGKSSILKFIRGIFNRTQNLENFTDLKADQNSFYKRSEFKGMDSEGVFKADSKVIVEFVRKGILYKIQATKIISAVDQTIQIFKLDDDNWVEIEEDEFLDFFEFEQYSQKQIFEISKDPNALLDRIDKNVEVIGELKDQQKIAKENFLKSCATLRSYQVNLKSRLKLITDIGDLKKNLEALDNAGINDLMAEKDAFTKEEQLLIGYKDQIQELTVRLQATKAAFDLAAPKEEDLSDAHKEELQIILNDSKENLKLKRREYEEFITSLYKEKETLEEKLLNSDWKKAYDAALRNYVSKKEELEAQGVENIEQYEEISKKIQEKEYELLLLDDIKEKEIAEKEQRAQYQEEYLQLAKQITSKRKEFIEANITDDKIKVSINPFRNQSNFELQIRKIIGKPTSYEDDFKKLKELCFNGHVERKITEVKEELRNIFFHANNQVVGGHFKNAIQSISSTTMDELEIFMPEDEIVVKYKPENSTTYKSLSTASAGQRTTAILTFLLSFGEIPLLLDQPEDDLDNRLVYDLIVDRLKMAKNGRQIIVVTHNANIPVNGDAEYIISMNSESKNISVLCSGTVEREEIKKEICDVMEGSEKAFKMRSERYKLV